MLEHGPGRSHRQRMLAKCAREESLIDAGVGTISKPPGTAVYCIDVSSLSGNDTDRHTAGNNFPVSGNISSYAKPGLGASNMTAEARDHLVEDQGRLGGCCNLPQRTQKLLWLDIRPPAFDWLNQNGCKISSVRLYVFESAFIVIVQNDRIADQRLGNSWSSGC